MEYPGYPGYFFVMGILRENKEQGMMNKEK